MSLPAPAITIVGLGPGAPVYRTVAARAALEEAGILFLRSADHPGMDDLLSRPGIIALDQQVGMLADGGRDWAHAARIVCDTAGTSPVTVAVPGHPRFGERLVIEVLAEAERRDLGVLLIEGLSAVDLIATALDMDPVVDDVQIVDAAQAVARSGDGPFSGGLFPFTPLRPMLLSRVYGKDIAAPLSRLLQRIFPPDHGVVLVEAAGIPAVERISRMTIAELAEADPGRLASLWVPAMDELSAVRDPRTQQRITARLRAPDGCPWDREQTHESLRDDLIDEAYEVLDAIDAGDAANLAEELGDLFLLICMHAQIAEENGTFTLEDVFAGISTKIVRRHPHVFGDAMARDAGDLAEIWAGVKAQEKAENPDSPAKASDGQPHSMPALLRAPKVLRKHPLKPLSPASTPDERSRNLLKAVAEVIATGDDPERVLREALTTHVASTNTP